MEEIITRKYGNRKLDLIDEFSNTELIDELFSQEIIMITWGIHPYSYPIYSSENVDSICPFYIEEFYARTTSNSEDPLLSSLLYNPCSLPP